MKKKQYKAPKLNKVGKVKNLTLANGSGGNDSGMKKNGNGN